MSHAATSVAPHSTPTLHIYIYRAQNNSFTNLSYHLHLHHYMSLIYIHVTKIMSSINNHNTRDQCGNTVILTPPPPWEVLVLVSHYLDPESLATASCVSKTWFACFSSDHLWSRLCSAHFPSLSSLSSATTTPFRRLYALGHAAQRLRHRTPCLPKISLHRLLFTLSLSTPATSLTVVKLCKDLETDPHGLFRFDVDVEEREWAAEELREARLTWNVVIVGEREEEREWKGMFTMSEERGGKGGFATLSGVDGWFSEELPPPPGMMSSGLVADLRLGMVAVEEGRRGCGRRESRVMRIEKMSVGVISLHNWGYVKIDEALSYLEHFLPLS